MDRYEFYKERYYSELERKGNTIGLHGIPVSLLTALLAAIFYFITNLGFDDIVFSWAAIAFFITIVPSVICIVWAFCHLYKSYTGGYHYSYIPDTKTLQEHEAKLLNDYKVFTNVNEIVQKKFRTYLIGTFIDCTAKNTANNDARSGSLFKANRMIVYAVGFIALSSIPFFIHQYRYKKEKKEEIKKEIIYIYTNKTI